MANLLNVAQFANDYVAQHMPAPSGPAPQTSQDVHSEIAAHGAQQASVPAEGSTSGIAAMAKPLASVASAV